MSSIKDLEKQSGILRIILFLDEHDKAVLSSIWPEANVPINAGYSSVSKLKELGLVSSTIDASSYPPKNLLSLTPKGKEVAAHLRMVENILRR